MSQRPLVHFEISERKVLLRLLDSLCVLTSLSLIGIIFDFDYFRINSQNWYWTLVLLLYFNFFASIFELYDLQKASKFDSVLQNSILCSATTVGFYMLTPLLTPSLPENRLQILFFFLAILVPLLLWRFVYITLISSPRFYKRVLVVGNSFDINLISSDLQKSDPNYVVVGYIKTEDRIQSEINEDNLIRFEIKDIKEAIKEHHINEIVVASGYKEGLMLSLYNQLSYLLKAGFPIKDYTQVYEEVTQRIPVQHVDKDFYRYFPFSRSNQNKFYQVFFRIFDVIIALVGLAFFILILPLLLIANLLGNRGSLFYRQERIGKYGEVFRILKLRTMVKDAESNGPQYAEKNDLRTTRFGKFLRRSRIDEIPQFYNVLKGEMSLIGPRPERPIFVKELSQAIPFYETRHVIKPGLTGWAQVKADYGKDQADSLVKLQYDLYYIKHRGIFLDLSILLKTFSTVIFFRGQ
ncbi:exopolysaccharide biosynthesis polyprenyl glycosylphosphotransferase [Salegentibacter holothuriorum]|uniref:Exopolysaccharide biosynthesis polyprenyl glycosylphosphotransferase n=1 Tax=Salegentibacter holothuriorum TaxID=241145 RepID=A0A1T5CMD2_9FLAO|nr:exopolysaccharide biosynthesis polyprenyl glycosylphosphotransferase [Salegentibacter holothuriorum]SKB60501.1 exopolysaccharide biosynthesis polyprenyl glycosylphosphotransferase [Salegentibacter holothuriorum]